MKHSLQIAGYNDLDKFITQILEYNEQDSEWTLDYGAPGFYFGTNDDKLANDAFGYANAHNLVINYICDKETA